MAENKQAFILYKDLIHVVRRLPKSKRGELFMTILEYVNDENPQVTDPILGIAWEPIMRQLKRDLAKYEDKKRKWSEAGKKSAESKRQQNSTESTNVENVQQNSTESTVTVNVNDTVTDSVTVTVTERERDENPPPFISEQEIEDHQITQMLVPEMFAVWKAKKPAYISHKETDYHALLEIAYHIAAFKGWKRPLVVSSFKDECLTSWGKIVDFILTQGWYADKTLDYFARGNVWQELVNKMNAARGAEPKKQMVL